MSSFYAIQTAAACRHLDVLDPPDQLTVIHLAFDLFDRIVGRTGKFVIGVAGEHLFLVFQVVLEEGETLGLSWAVLDYDEDDSRYEGFWNLSHHTRMDYTASLLPNFKLMPLQKRKRQR